MALVTWEPFGGLSSLRREINRLFGDFEEGVRHGLIPHWEFRSKCHKGMQGHGTLMAMALAPAGFCC